MQLFFRVAEGCMIVWPLVDIFEVAQGFTVSGERRMAGCW
jgi:hypothetical protein